MSSAAKKDIAGLTDEDLVQKIQEVLNEKKEKLKGYLKNPEVDVYFEEVYKRYQKKLEYYCSKFIFDRDVLADLFHDIFIKIYLNIHRYHYSKSFKAWIYKIAHNSCINYVRKSKHQDLTLLNKKIQLKENQVKEFIEICESGEQNIEEKLINQELQEAIDQAVAKLPYQYVNVYFLKTAAQLTFEEIAKIEKVSSRSVKTIYHNALFFIKEQLAKEHFALGDRKT
ncbi:MAG: sigma-70 family RNA polymerase sigma factor [Spirochaetia bacterium]|nr:sigma-70 family RNA polymerase sigma factor [Spirochaetia bacterium]